MAATPGYVSNSELAARISALVDRWDTREYQMIDLLTLESGNVTVTDGLGKDHSIPSYRSLLTSVSGMVDDLTGTAAQVSEFTNSARRFSESATASSGRAAASAVRAEELANGIAASVADGKVEITEHVAAANAGIAISVSDAAASAAESSASERAAASSAADAAASAAAAAGEANDASADAARAASSRNEALAYKNGAEAAQFGALSAQEASEASRDEAGLIANAPVGTVLPQGGYSALHWAKQAQAIATGTLVYVGTWDAATARYPEDPSTGHFYKVIGSGVVEGAQFSPGDQIIFNGDSWDKVDNTDSVSSVAGKMGTVELVAEDIGGLGALATRGDVDFTLHVKGKPPTYPATPHGHAKAEVGLGNVDNTADRDKPVSDAVRAALIAEEGARASADAALGFRIPGKNRLINGNFDFAQRGAANSFTAATGDPYTADRWIVGYVGVTGNWGIGGTPIGGVPESSRFLGYNIASLVNPPTASAYIGQRIEGVRTLAGKTATISFWARSTPAGKKVGFRILQVFGAGGSPSGIVQAWSPETKTLTAEFQKFSITLNVPSVAGKTLGNNGNDCLFAVLDYVEPDKYGGQLAGQTGLFEVAQVQLEEGDVATGFEFRHRADELALCQRYYEKSYLLDAYPGSISGWGRVNTFYDRGGGGIVSTSDCRFKVTKRATPAVSVYDDQTGQINKTSGNNGMLGTVHQITSVGTSGFQINYTAAPGSWGASFHFVADAEI